MQLKSGENGEKIVFQCSHGRGRKPKVVNESFEDFGGFSKEKRSCFEDFGGLSKPKAVWKR